MTRLSLFALLVAAPLAGQQPARRPLAADTAAIRAAMASAFGARGDAEPESLFAIQLPRIRTAVLTLLGQGTGAEAVNLWLGSLPGFQGPQHGRGTTIAGVHFFSTLDRDRSSYVLSPLAPERPGELALAVNFPSVNGPSLFAILRRDSRRWRLAFAESSDNQLEAYLLAIGSAAPLIVLFDNYWRADGSEGTLHAWRLTAGLPEEIPLHLPTLQDAEVIATDSTLVVTAAQFLEYTQFCVMCTRRVIETTIHAAAPAPFTTTRELTPWVAVVDSFYGLLDSQRLPAAKALLADSTLFIQLVAGQAYSSADTGSLEGGVGEVELHLEVDSTESRYLKVTSIARPDGQWRIARLITGHWEGDEVRWDSGGR